MTFLRLFPVLAALVLFGFTSCKEDIDFAGDSKEIAIVYGLLNQLDSIHYVKITRAFGGTNNAPVVAQIPDSSYFPVVTVTIKEYVNEALKRTWVLEDTLIENKEAGAFYYPEQKLYYFKTTSAAPLNSNAVYKLTADINNGEFQVLGETPLVKGLAISNPSGNGSFSFATSNVEKNGYASTSVKVATGTAGVIDARMEIFLREYFPGGPVDKSFMWKLGELDGSEIVQNSAIVASGKTFYELVRDNVTIDESITRRQMVKLKLYVTGGTSDLSKYLAVNQPSSTLAQNKPSFTNLTTSDGRRVLGIFSSRCTIVMEKLAWVNFPPYYRAIDKNSVQELTSGGITGALLFCSDNINDQAESYYCN